MKRSLRWKLTLLIRILLSAAFIVQFVLALSKYKNPPIGTFIQQKSEPAFQYPSITFCPRFRKKSGYTDPNSTGEGLTGAFNSLSDLDDIVYGTYLLEKNITAEDGKWEKHWIIVPNFDACFTFTMKKKVHLGRHSVPTFVLNIEDYNSYVITVHDPDEYLPSGTKFIGQEFLRLSTKTKSTLRVSYFLKRSLRSLLPTSNPDFPCVPPDERLLKAWPCSNLYYNRLIGCVIPWSQNISTEGLDLDQAQPTRLCNRRPDFMTSLERNKALVGVYHEISEKDFAEKTGCTAPCTYTQYGIEEEFSLLSSDTLEQGGKSFLEFKLFLKDPQLVSTEDRYLYGLSDLLADLGGYMGLLLGASLLSLFEVVGDVVENLVARIVIINK